MTYQEKIEKLFGDRGIALSSLSSAYKEEINKIDELNFYYSYLFGTGGNNIGLINILELYYKEINTSVGRTTSRPALHNGFGTSEAAWKNAFNLAVTVRGDDAEGFYPPDGNNIGNKTFNENSDYLTTNLDNNETEGGIVSTLISGSAVRLAIGSAADTSTGKSSPDFGVGIIGQRTADNTEVETNEGTTEDPIIVTTYGDGTTDNPDWYNTPYKTNFENALQNIINSLTSYKNYLDDIKGYLEYIQNGEHAQFEEASMASDMPTSDISAINTLQDNIQTHIDDLQEELDYFSSFTASDNIGGQTGYVRSEFDNKLNTTVPNILTAIVSTLQTRATNVRTNIDYNNTSGSFRKWIVFWIKQAIGKFNGPLITLDGIGDSVIPNAITSLTNANQALNIMFGPQYENYLIKPEVFAAFFNPVLNEETAQIITRRVGVVWLANIAANRYNIYRRKVNGLTSLFNNQEQWSGDFLIEEYAQTNDDQTMVRSDYMDEGGDLQNGGLFVYRVKSFDTAESPNAWNRLDSVLGQNTSSQQSNVIGKTFTIESFTGNVMTLTEEVDDNFGVCYIENKYYGVLKIKETKITLSENITGNPTNLIEIKASVFVP